MENQKLRQVRKIITHENCADGVASAILLHDVLPTAEVQFVQYNTAVHEALPVEPGMLFCDFTPPINRAQEFVAAGAIVFDHHQRDRVTPFGENGIFADVNSEPGVSGAVLALRHVWKPFKEEARDLELQGTSSQEERDRIIRRFEFEAFRADRLATLAGIRDTWQTKDPGWKDACIQEGLLRFVPYKEWLERHRPFDIASVDWWNGYWKWGELIRSRHEAAVAGVVKKAYRFRSIRGTRVVAFEGGSPLTSDGAELIGEEADLVVGFSFGVDHGVPNMVFSLRSHTDFSCASFARHMGGGGHEKAAGFTVKFDAGKPSLLGRFLSIFTAASGLKRLETAPNPFRLAEILINQFEVQAR